MVIASGMFKASYRAVPVARLSRRFGTRSQAKPSDSRESASASRRPANAPARSASCGSGAAGAGSGGRLSTIWSASSSDANSNWRASDMVPRPASASRLLASTKAAAARRLSSSPGRQATRYGRPAMVRSTSAILGLGGSNQLVELGDRLAHLRAKLLLAPLGLVAARGERPLDAAKGALGALQSL